MNDIAAPNPRRHTTRIAQLIGCWHPEESTHTWAPLGTSTGQPRRNRASALPEAILVRSAGRGMVSKNCPTAAASGWWKG
jgi:hypothetical protein